MLYSHESETLFIFIVAAFVDVLRGSDIELKAELFGEVSKVA